MYRFYRFVLYFAGVKYLWLICDLYGVYIDHLDPQIASDVVMSRKAKKKKKKKHAYYIAIYYVITLDKLRAIIPVWCAFALVRV